MGSTTFSDAASTFVPTRGLFEMLLVSFHCVVLFLFPGSLTGLYWVQHLTTSISSRGNHALSRISHQRRGSIIHAVCRFLQSCSNAWRMACFWWQLTHNITVHIIGLSLKNSCLCDQYEKDPILWWAALWQLIRNPGLVEAGWISLQVLFLLVLKTS